MTTKLYWQIPLTILACVVASVAVAWGVSRVMGFETSPSLVAVLSAALSAAAVAAELRSDRKKPSATAV